MAKKRVHWSTEEKLALAESVAQVRKKCPGGKFSWLRELSRAQKAVLPSDRHRRIVACTSVPWLKQMVGDWIEKDKAQQTSPEVEVEYTLDQFTDTQLLDELKNRIVEQISSKVSCRVIEQISSHVITSLSKNLTNAASQLIKPKIEPQQKVLIVGLLDRQASEIHNIFSQSLSLSYISSDKNTKNLKQIPKLVNQVDHVLVMTKFISHALNNKIMKFGKNKTKLVYGGTSQLEEILLDLV
ncbi:MAG: DUF2325 domain-containing protein [Candidatus Lokiarchaeota archaeon]|nr:DUF2325 domain-containing protein [Candidatus Lokiarchaeota archaeon]